MTPQDINLEENAGLTFRCRMNYEFLPSHNGEVSAFLVPGTETVIYIKNDRVIGYDFLRAFFNNCVSITKLSKEENYEF